MARKLIYYYLILGLIASTFSSCITNRQKKYLQEDIKSPYRMSEYQEYRLRINDELTYYLLSVNKESQSIYNASASGAGSGFSFRIYEDGTIYLPFLGQVKVVGLTVREAQEMLTEKYREMVPDAEIRLALVNNYFYVLGDNGKGQFYLYKENLNIYQAIAMAGDISSQGDKSKIKIVRKAPDGTDHVQTFDLRKESVIESEFYYVRPNDLIYIPTSSRAFFRVESFPTFVSLFLTPLSLLILVVSTVK